MAPSIRKSFIVTCLTALCIQIHFSNKASQPFNYKHNEAFGSHQPKARLGDGCYHVLLDVGSNIGMHARFLFEPDKFPKSKSSVPKLNEEFGLKRDNRDFCVFSFGKLFSAVIVHMLEVLLFISNALCCLKTEPNPYFKERHLELQRIYAAFGWRYHPIHAGVSNEDGHLTFYHSHMKGKPGENDFSALAKKTLYGTDATPVEVPIIRLSKWIQDEIRDRQIPKEPHMQYPFGPKVLMKLDIEGLEYKVFPDLLTTGALCETIDFMFGEFHWNGNYRTLYPMKVTKDVVLNMEQAKDVADHLVNLMKMTETCKTRLTLEDDEAYEIDTVELPTPPEKS